MKKQIGLSLIFLIASFCSIADIDTTSGAYTNGSTVVINGSGFGSHQLNTDFLDNKDGLLSTGAPGEELASHPRWDGAGGGVRSPLYIHQSDEQSRVSGQNVLRGYVHANEGPYNAPLVYSFASPVEPQTWIYFTYWAKMDSNSSEGQWKMWRLSNIDTVSDHKGELAFFNWHNAKQLRFTNSQDSLTANTGYMKDSRNVDFPNHGHGLWTRIEVAINTSDIGQQNGTVEFYRHSRESSNAPVQPEIDIYNGWDLPNIKTYGSSSDFYQYLVFQNYLGNGHPEGYVYMDDVYVQTGTKKRVEICESSNWTQCGHREIQYPLSWSDNRITFELNSGAFLSNTSVYVHVINDNGQSIGSSAITLNDISGVSAPPAAPTGFSVETIQ